MKKENDRDDAFANLIEIISVRRRQFITGFLTVFVVAVIGVFFMPSSFDASVKINVSLPTIPKTSNVPYLSDLKNLKTFVQNQLEIIKSRFIFEKVVRELSLHEKTKEKKLFSIGKFKRKLKSVFVKDTLDSFDEAILNLYDNTSFSSTKGSSIIEVTVNEKTSQKAIKIANSLAETYTNYINNHLFSKTQNAYDFIAAQISRVSNELDDAQSELSEFKKRENVLSLLSLRDNHNSTENRLTELKMKYEQIIAQGRTLNKSDDAGGVSKPTNIHSEIYRIQQYDSAIVKNLKTSLENLNNELIRALKNYTEKHPKVIVLNGQIKDIEMELSGQMSIDMSNRTKFNLENLNQDRDYLVKQINILERQLIKLSDNEFQFSRLMVNVENKQKEYLRLKVELENAQILEANAMQGGSIKIVDYAYAIPDNKKKKVLLVVGFIASIFFGLGMAFIAEYRDDSLMNREDVEKYLQLPVLATIPFISEKMRKDSKK